VGLAHRGLAPLALGGDMTKAGEVQAQKIAEELYTNCLLVEGGESGDGVVEAATLIARHLSAEREKLELAARYLRNAANVSNANLKPSAKIARVNDLTRAALALLEEVLNGR
jgi:hypothetical protein